MPLILGTNSIKDTGYNVANSIMFDDGDSSYLQKSATAGNRKTFTFSTWLKRGNLTYGYATFFSSDQATDNSFRVTFDDDDGSNDDHLMVYYYTGSHQLKFITNREFRDVSAWYHIVIAVDTTQSTEANRFKIYVNGTQETSFATDSYPSQNLDTSVNQSGAPTRVGAGTSLYFDGYMAETVLIDGTQYAASDFGEFDSDSPTIWKPKDVSGLTFGNNGFYLNYENAAELGTDANGGTALSETNLDAQNQSIDTCTNNFATMNVLANKVAASTFSQGNLNIAHSSNKGGNISTIGFSTGKWYAEMKILSIPTDERWHWGIIPHDNWYADDPINTGNDGIMLSAFNSTIYANNGSGHAIINNFYGNSTTAFDSFSGIVGLALDATSSTKTIAISRDGAWITGSGTTDTDFSNALKVDISTAFARYPSWHIGTGTGTTTADGVYSLNFGSPNFAISSGNADGNGYGNFEYAVPSGYFSLCTKNLAEYGG